MGEAIVYCKNCGNRISEEEFAEGRAVHVLDKDYCVKCKGVLGSVSAVKAPKREPVRKPSTQSGVLRRTATGTRAASGIRRAANAPPSRTGKPDASSSSVRRHQMQRHHGAPPAKRKRPLVGLYAGIGVAVVIAIVLAMVVHGGKNGTNPEKGNGSRRADPECGAKKAQEAYAAIQVRIEASPDDCNAVLTEIAKAESTVTGTQFASQVARLKDEYLERKRVGDMTMAAKKDIEALTSKIQDRLDSADAVGKELYRLIESTAKQQVFRVFEKDLCGIWTQLQRYEVEDKLAAAEKLFKECPGKWGDARELVVTVKFDYEQRELLPLEGVRTPQGGACKWTFKLPDDLMAKADALLRKIDEERERNPKHHQRLKTKISSMRVTMAIMPAR